MSDATQPETIRVDISCAMCATVETVDVPKPQGWAMDDEGDYSEMRSFCPTHAAVREWTTDQCPGCVASWGDCGLWEAFGHSSRRTVTSRHLDVIRSGRCPFRVNGTMFSRSANGSLTLESLDISSSSPAGNALADAIDEYVERYPAAQY